MIPIVFSTDHNYVMQTGVCILSLLKSAGYSIYTIYILAADDVTDEDRNILIRQVSLFRGHTLDFINPGYEFSEGYEIRGISRVAYYRLLIPWLLPQYDRIIYSDVDVIFRLSLEDIYNINLKDNYFGAVKAAFFRYSAEPAHYALKLGLDPFNYYNSGFLLINSKMQRDDDLKSRILKYTTSQLTYQDQDIINLVCQGRIMPISPRYCITPAFYEQCIVKNPDIYEFYGSKKDINKYLKGNDCILHYAGAKPWNSFVFAFADWWNVYQQSIFYNEEYQLEKNNEIINQIRNPKISLFMVLGMVKRKVYHRFVNLFHRKDK